MFVIAFAWLALALSATAIPLHPYSNSTSSGAYSLAVKVTRSAATGAIFCSPGSLVCSTDGTHFAICPSFGKAVFMDVAAGTSCSNGQIKAVSMGTGAPAPVPAPAAPSSPASGSASSPPPVTPPAASAAPSAAAPSPAASPSASAGASPTYTFFTGSGEHSAGWPSQQSWMSFDTLFQSNYQIMSQSCTQFNVANNSPAEIANIKSAIQSVAQSTGIDPRFILAIGLQESGLCSRSPTTNYGVENPGLFQSHDGAGSCNRGSSVQNPCPQSEITQMVKDGVEGTSEGPGLQQLLAQTGSKDVSQYYKAARMYNSGSIAASGNLDDGIATHCYSSDIANRLLGWTTTPNLCAQKLGTA